MVVMPDYRQFRIPSEALSASKNIGIKQNIERESGFEIQQEFILREIESGNEQWQDR